VGGEGDDEALDGVLGGLDGDVQASSRAVAAVTGPMQATTGGTASAPTASTKWLTVDDEVKVTASAVLTCSRSESSNSAATVR